MDRYTHKIEKEEVGYKHNKYVYISFFLFLFKLQEQLQQETTFSNLLTVCVQIPMS